ncbi:hypothetical protein AOLI_G00088420 [Acnodon oligacanthus]
MILPFTTRGQKVVLNLAGKNNPAVTTKNRESVGLKDVCGPFDGKSQSCIQTLMSECEQALSWDKPPRML